MCSDRDVHAKPSGVQDIDIFGSVKSIVLRVDLKYSACFYSVQMSQMHADVHALCIPPCIQRCVQPCIRLCIPLCIACDAICCPARGIVGEVGCLAILQQLSNRRIARLFVGSIAYAGSFARSFALRMPLQLLRG